MHFILVDKQGGSFSYNEAIDWMDRSLSQKLSGQKKTVYRRSDCLLMLSYKSTSPCNELGVYQLYIF